MTAILRKTNFLDALGETSTNTYIMRKQAHEPRTLFLCIQEK